MVEVYLVNPSGSRKTIAVSGSSEIDVIDAKIARAINSASSAQLVFPPSNKRATAFSTLNPTVAIYDNNTQMFVGSVNGGVKSDIWGRMEIELDGALAFLNDISKAPFTASGMTVSQYLESLVGQYNAAVKDNRKLSLGGVTVTGQAEFSHANEYSRMSDLVREVVEKHGGFLTETYLGTNSPRIDYFATAMPYAQPTEPLVFGRDIVDFEKVIDFSDYASRVYAVGRGGITASAINTDAEQAWGRVDYPYKSNAETQAALQAEVDAVLAAKSVPLTTVSSTAIGASKFVPGTVRKCVDYRSMITVDMIVNTVELDLLHPENNRVIFGKAAPKTFTNTRNLLK